MKVCITEKPSVARDIANILAGPSAPKRDGYIDCGEYKVTWTFGHLCCLKEPHDYSDLWKRWSLGSLPMIPPRFGIKLIDIDNYKHQFAVIESLIKQADEVINCGDAGQEGELIQRWVMQKASISCPVRRLWISSLTDESIREGFKALRPQADFDNLYYAGLSRAIGDWVLGMNATRLYSLRYSEPGRVLSIGRVQTPTLALIVKRHQEIVDFKPEDFWELKTTYRETPFNSGAGRFKSVEDAQMALDKVSGQPLVIDSVEKKRGREAPPRLFDLTSLQVEANKKWGWTADVTLKLIQSLYEKKVTTYPRVDTTYLSEDIYPKIPEILRKMTPYADKTGIILSTRIPKSKRVFDNAKVTDHHAIIPTGESPSTLAGDERKLYHLIALRFIAAFYPDCQFSQTVVSAHSVDIPFKATGKIIDAPGWRAVLSPDPVKASEDNDEGRVLPDFVAGESGPHSPELVKKTTQPPKPYTEGSLLRAMEGAGRTVDDEALREAMKENGIGRPSTRAAIIETLFKRGYIKRERKSIVPCQAGIDLIATIKEELLKSAKLTGLWENKLRRIERGEYSPSEFINELKVMVSDIVMSVLSDNSSRRIVADIPVPSKAETLKAEAPKKKRAAPIRSLSQVKCPLCGQGHLLKGRAAYGCSRYAEGCRFVAPFTDYPADLKPGELARKLKKNHNATS
ncbi:MAG: DNA topoisomerase 3 [Pseudoflavonifractor sp.]|nr:DNA topoisomerase 3 [Alloprevotella sp.]MCM1117298.1 DNA topoisomerase 3 [Pseudoflavonifractor sp.]